MPTSVSGYSLCATQGDPIDEENEATNNNNYVQDQLTAFTNSARQHQLQKSHVIYQQNEPPTLSRTTSGGSAINSRAGLAMSASNYSMSSGINLSIVISLSFKAKPFIIIYIYI